MPHTLILIILSFLSVVASAQVITTLPAMPTDSQKIQITFYADRGNKGLIDFSGDVYAHTGLITEKSTPDSMWKYVKATWSANTEACKLMKTGTNQYQLTIPPNIREFYGVTSGEKIMKMAFVFRNSDGSKAGRDLEDKDIFADVYEEGVNVRFAKPSKLFTFTNKAQVLDIEVNASEQDSIRLFLDDVYIKSSVTSPLTHSIETSGSGKHMLTAFAFKNAQIAKADTSYYIVRSEVINAPLPNGYRDGISYPDSQSATFVIYAPYKKNIYLIGDMNQWIPDSNYAMKKDGDRFWLTINNLTPGKEYEFQYLIDDTLRIADPYCDKTCDPSDRSIPENIYPNLLSYPVNKTTDIASVLQTGQKTYPWENADFIAPPKEKLIIYELLIRDFTGNKDIKTITDTLVYLKKLGINAIELMPFNEFEGNESWGYNPSFYFAPDKAYGTKNDYKKFIDACHKHGIAVIQDIVLNHSYKQSPLVRMYFEEDKPSLQNPWYNREHNMQNPDSHWGFDFNHQSIFTQKLVDSITSYWMHEYKIDGFRFDFTKGFTNTPYGPSSWASDYDTARIRILKRIASEIWKRKANAYVIFEHLAVNLEEAELANHGIMLWGNMNYNYNQATMGYSDGWDFSWISYKNRGWSNKNVIGYMESHDEERLMFKNITYGNANTTYNIKETGTALERMKLAAAFFLTIPGPKMIWQFGELGYDVSINAGGRLSSKPLHWEYYNHPLRHNLYETFACLNILKKQEPVFSSSDFTMDVSASIKKISWRLENDYVFLTGNFDVTDKTASMEFPSTGTWYEYVAGDSMVFSETTQAFILKPGEFKIYSNKKLIDFGKFPVSAKEIMKTHTKTKVYPNPFTSEIYIDSPLKIKECIIYGMDGKRLLKSGILKDNIYTPQLSQGIYVLKIYFKNGRSEVFKIIRGL